MWLKKRNSLILSRLVQLYTSTHKPVSSNQLSTFIPFSDSTIRKELQELETQGYICKPSASSGRIPTDKGLKHYLRELINNLEPGKDTAFLPKINDSDFNHLSSDVLSRLSDTTNNIGFLYLNSIFDLNFKKLKLIKVGSHRVMTIIQSLNNWTFSKLFTTNKNYSEKELQSWEIILNKEFKGRNLRNTFKSIRNRLYKEKEKYLKIYRELYYLLGAEELLTAEFFFKGTVNLLDTEQVNPGRVKTLLAALEEKEKLSHFLNDILSSHNRVRTPIVAFGSDTGISQLEDFIFILSNVYYSNYSNCSQKPIGNVGVVGPKFMPYPQTLSQVGQCSTFFSKILSKNPMEV